jgi:hypothetical protein
MNGDLSEAIVPDFNEATMDDGDNDSYMNDIAVARQFWWAKKSILDKRTDSSPVTADDIINCMSPPNEVGP